MREIDFISTGTTRIVIAVGEKVIKIAKNQRGVAANSFEYELWTMTTERRRAMLCPALAIFANGRFLVASRASPLSEEEFSSLRSSGELPEWDYHPAQDEFADPSEYKWTDWGRFEGRIVRVDYSAVPAVFNVPTTPCERD